MYPTVVAKANFVITLYLSSWLFYGFCYPSCYLGLFENGRVLSEDCLRGFADEGLIRGC